MPPSDNMTDYDPEDLLKKIQLARQSGIPEEMITQRVQQQYGVNPAQIKPTPELQKWEENWFAGPAVKFGGVVLEALRKGGQLISNPDYAKVMFGDLSKVSQQERDRLEAAMEKANKPVFISEHRQELIRKKPLETGLKTAAGAASYLVPAGKTFGTALALGAAMGGLRAASEEKATMGTVAGGLAGGAIAGGLFYGAGKVFQKGREWLGKGKLVVGKKAAEDLLKATPTAYKNAAEAGYDLRVLVKKYGVVGNLDDMVGPIESPNSGWFQQALGDTEKVLQTNLKSVAKQKVDLTPVINQLNAQRDKLLAAAVPDEEALGALDGLISTFTNSFKGRDMAGKFMGGNNVSAERALEMVRNANEVFGKSIVQSTKGTVIDQGNKLIAQSLRHTLKNQFPKIGEALTREHELIILRNVLQDAQYKGLTGLGLGKFDITRPLTLAEPITKTPAVSSRLAQMQSAVPETPAGLQPGFINPGELPNVRSSVPPWRRLVDTLDAVIAKGNRIKAEEIGYVVKNALDTEPDFQAAGNEALAKIIKAFPTLKSRFLPSMNLEMLSENALGVAPGAKIAFDTAFTNRDWATVLKLIPTMPKEYVAKFIDRIPLSMRGTPGLQPGSMDLGYISDAMKAGPLLKTPTALDIAGRITAQTGALIGARAAAPKSPGGFVSGTTQNVKVMAKQEMDSTQNDDERRMKLAYLMWKYPKQATQIKNMYEVVYGKDASTKAKTEAQVARESVYSISQEALASLQSNPKIITGTLSRLEEAKAGGTLGYVFKGDPDTLEFNRKISNLIASIAKARAGTSFTPNEEKMLNKYAPKIGDSRQMLETKLANLVNFYRTELEKQANYQIIPDNAQFINQVPVTPQELYAP